MRVLVLLVGSKGVVKSEAERESRTQLKGQRVFQETDTEAVSRRSVLGAGIGGVNRIIPVRKRNSAAKVSRKHTRPSLWKLALALFRLSVRGRLASDALMRHDGLLIPPCEKAPGTERMLQLGSGSVSGAEGQATLAPCRRCIQHRLRSARPRLCTWTTQQNGLFLFLMLEFCYFGVS